MPRPKGLPKTGGRQKGVANTRTREIADAAIREGLSPLQYMLAVLRDENADPERRDRMAAAAAPYIHPRLANVEARIGVSGHEAALAALEEIPAINSTPLLPAPPVN